MSGDARLKTVALKIPGLLDVVFDADEREIQAVRDMTNEFRTRRAFQVGRGSAEEQPLYFIQSLVDARTEMRKLSKALPPKAAHSRLIMLMVIDWLAEIDDEIYHRIRTMIPNAYSFQNLEFEEMVQVMEAAWPTVEDVRARIDRLMNHMEKQYGL